MDSHRLLIPLGFYYVCVDFNPQPAASHAGLDGLEDFPESPALSPSSLPKPEPTPRNRRESMSRGARRMSRSTSSSQAVPSNVATMSGFYFHQQSEPYVQLCCAPLCSSTHTMLLFFAVLLTDTSSYRWSMCPTTRALALSSGRVPPRTCAHLILPVSQKLPLHLGLFWLGRHRYPTSHLRMCITLVAYCFPALCYVSGQMRTTFLTFPCCSCHRLMSRSCVCVDIPTYFSFIFLCHVLVVTLSSRTLYCT